MKTGLQMNKEIFVFWFGSNMSENRQRCYDSIVRNSGVSVKLIDETNLKIYCTDLHPGFQYLSATHKSDYLRSYFMYNYGGGYTDIKYCDFDWNYYFDYLYTTKYDFVGYHELQKHDVCVSELRNYFNLIAGPVQFIFKSKTDFAKEWLSKTNQKMDEIFNQLQDNPGTYHPRAETGGVQGEKKMFKESKYPLLWNELLGKIFQPLSYTYLNSGSLTMPYPNIENYR
jgi:hypothetical protein